jgi:hypothetical protein
MTGAPRSSYVLLDRYESASESLRRNYTQAVRRQWDPNAEIDWTLQVPYGSEVPVDDQFGRALAERSPVRGMTPAQLSEVRWDLHGWLVSQFLHGEQGALLAASRAVEHGPDKDVKLCAAIQVADEARHVEVFSRYVGEHLPERAFYPVNPSLGALLQDVCGSKSWDLVLLGMQVIVESVASSAFRVAPRLLHDPLILQITDRVSVDEARHVSFGIVALRDVRGELTSAEQAEREEFVLDSVDAMHEQYLMASVWDRAGADAAAGREFVLHDLEFTRLRQVLFAKMTQALRHIGMLTPAVRDRLAEFGVTVR